MVLNFRIPKKENSEGRKYYLNKIISFLLNKEDFTATIKKFKYFFLFFYKFNKLK